MFKTVLLEGALVMSLLALVMPTVAVTLIAIVMS